MFKKILLVAAVLFFSVTTLPAIEKGGVDVPDTMSLEDGKGELILNGVGIRSKWGFKVYVGGLYLKAKTSNSQQIINADEPMAITMTWKRNGPLKKVRGVFDDGFKYAAGDNYDKLKKEIGKFLGSMVKAKKKDIWKFVYIPGEGTFVNYKGKLAATIPGLDFKKALFGIWLLETDAFDGDEDLRDGMLGK